MSPEAGVRRVVKRGKSGGGPARRPRPRIGVAGTRRMTKRDEGCVCPSCGVVTPHPLAGPCNRQKCPRCGAKMVRG